MKKIHLLITLFSIFAFVTCQTTHSDKQVSSQYTEMGNKLVKQSFDTLSKSLKAAISAGGFEHAVSYCKVNAVPLTDTYATDSIIIRRTALRYRSPSNAPTTDETRILNLYASQKGQGIVNDSLKSITEESADGRIHYYKPIVLQEMCTNCHGPKNAVGQQALWTAIDSLYPEDMAYDFKPGDLRGMWHITFIKKEDNVLEKLLIDSKVK